MLQTLTTTTKRFDTPSQRKGRVKVELDEDGLPFDRLQTLVDDILPRRGELVRYLWLDDVAERKDDKMTGFVDVLEATPAVRYLNLVIRNESFGDKTLLVRQRCGCWLSRAEAAGQAHIDRGPRSRHVDA